MYSAQWTLYQSSSCPERLCEGTVLQKKRREHSLILCFNAWPPEGQNLHRCKRFVDFSFRTELWWHCPGGGGHCLNDAELPQIMAAFPPRGKMMQHCPRSWLPFFSEVKYDAALPQAMAAFPLRGKYDAALPQVMMPFLHEVKLCRAASGHGCLFSPR